MGASISGAPVTIGLIGVNVIAFVLLEATGGSTDPVTLYRWGAKYGPAIASGELWRLVLPIFMHIGFFHLLTNSIGLLIFGSMAEKVFGSTAYLAIYLMAGILGNVASFVITPALGAGASGSVFGVIGAFGMYLLLNRRALGEMGRQALTSIALIVVLNIVIGFTTAGIDNAAHVGGLLAGAGMAYLIAPRQRVMMMPGWSEFAPPRMGMQIKRHGSGWVVYAVAVALAITVIGVWVRTRDYNVSDEYARRGFQFLDFESGTRGPFFRSIRD
jgi:rhomboid protease GluP